MIKGDKIKLVHKMGVFDNIGEICEVTDIQEGGIICFKFGGCHLGCMSYDEYEKYFEKVEEPVKRTWSEWRQKVINFTDINGDLRTGIYLYRNNGKKVQVKCGGFEPKTTCRAEATCYKEDEFDFEKGLALAKSRLIVKFLDNQVKFIAKVM